MFGAFRTAPSMTRCQPLEYDTIDSQNNDVVDALSEAMIHYNGEQYELMPIPDRGKVSTHAIHGTLFKESCIERYDVYRRQKLNQDHHHHHHHGTTTKTATSIDTTREMKPDSSTDQHADVVAIVTFGSDLDGHQNIVHGGIIALIVDDVLGFGYFAILLREHECRMMERNIYSNNNNSTQQEDTFDPNIVAVTANLSINYRAPVPTNTTVVVEATIVLDDETAKSRRERNKFHWNVKVTSLDRATTYCQATSLYVIPKRQILLQ